MIGEKNKEIKKQGDLINDYKQKKEDLNQKIQLMKKQKEDEEFNNKELMTKLEN